MSRKSKPFAGRLANARDLAGKRGELAAMTALMIPVKGETLFDVDFLGAKHVYHDVIGIAINDRGRYVNRIALFQVKSSRNKMKNKKTITLGKSEATFSALMKDFSYLIYVSETDSGSPVCYIKKINGKSKITFRKSDLMNDAKKTEVRNEIIAN